MLIWKERRINRIKARTWCVFPILSFKTLIRLQFHIGTFVFIAKFGLPIYHLRQLIHDLYLFFHGNYSMTSLNWHLNWSHAFMVYNNLDLIIVGRMEWVDQLPISFECLGCVFTIRLLLPTHHSWYLLLCSHYTLKMLKFKTISFSALLESNWKKKSSLWLEFWEVGGLFQDCFLRAFPWLGIELWSIIEKTTEQVNLP